jgi:8-amino-7-oxononanoate synthase
MSPLPDFDSFLLQHLHDLRISHLDRVRRTVRRIDSTHVELDGHRLINFAANDYLGLSHHPRVLSAAVAAMQQDGLGSGASPLVTGYTAAHALAEEAIARWKGTEQSVLLPSGHQANHAAVQTLAAVTEKSGGVRFLIDKLAHASLLDAVRATGQPFRIYPHNTLAKLRRLLEERQPGQVQVVITESIFSMDGDAADLAGLAKLKAAHPFLLLLDEAHASGVYGPAGAGYAAELNLSGLADISIVTLSKAIGCIGGAVCGSRAFCQTLINHGRALIYSTSLPPAIAAAAAAALGVMRDEPERQERVRTLARRLRAAIAGVGLSVPVGDAPIVPIIVGSPADALAAAEKLRERGLLIPAIRPPTVSRGSARLRITLSCDHTDAEVKLLVESLRSVFAQPSPLPRVSRKGTQIDSISESS